MKFRSMVLIFGLFAISLTSPEKPNLSELAAKCGSEIDWLTDPGAARERAKKEDRLILWYIHEVEKPDGKHYGPMYKAHVLDRYMQEGPFMDEDLIRLIDRKFVAFTQPRKKGVSDVADLAKELKVARYEFVEPGFVIMTHDGKLIHKIDGIRTFSGEFLTRVFKTVLENHPEWNAPGVNTAVEDRAAKKDGRDPGDRLVGEALALQRSSKLAEAEQQYAAVLKDHPGCPRFAEAQYRLGAIMYLTSRDDQAEKLWRELIDHSPDSRWAWKAAAELTGPGPTGHGPLVHAFEPLESCPEYVFQDLPVNTARKRTVKDADAVIQDAITFLLRHQRPDGMWRDTQYDFVGKPSYPNTVMAITAIAANALLAWQDRDPRIPKALEKAEQAMMDSTRLADIVFERPYVHAYRLMYFVRRLSSASPEEKKRYRKAAEDIIAVLEKERPKNGTWMHEGYGNAFVGSTVLQALSEAQQAGLAVPESIVQPVVESLKKMRGENGAFPYATAGPAELEGSAGRMPHGERALYLYGASSMENLKKSVEEFFKNKSYLDRVRLYDYHADPFRNAGFFFFYGYHAASEAARLLPAEDRKKYLAQLLEGLPPIQEIDGSFVDDHEIGKCYSTSMALLVLKNCTAAQ